MRKCPFLKTGYPFRIVRKGGKEGNGVVMRMSVQKTKTWHSILYF